MAMKAGVRSLILTSLAWSFAQACSAAEDAAGGFQDPNGGDSVGQVSQELCLVGPAFPSCYGQCGHLACSPAYPEICCACDEGCAGRGDCCCDFETYCPPQPTCEGHCGGAGSDGSCFCDDLCIGIGDCCSDFEPLCWDWPIVFGTSTATDVGKAVAVDSARNVYIAANVGAAWNFGVGSGVERVEAGFNNLGTVRWSVFSDDSTSGTLQSVAVDSGGRPWYVGGKPAMTSASGAVLQLNPSSGALLRSHLWLTAFFVDLAISSTSVTTVGAGYAGGGTWVPVVVNVPFSGTITTRVGPDTATAVVYQRVAVDSTGNVYAVVASSTGGPLLTTGITKLTPTATRVWLRDIRPLNVLDIALDGTTSIAAAACDSTSNCPAPFAQPAGSAVLFKLDASGNIAWQVGFDPTSGTAKFTRVVRDTTGRVHVLGHTTGPLTFGSTTIGAAGSQTAFVATFNTAGTFLDVEVFCQAASGSSCSPEDMAVAPNIARYVIGKFSGTAVISEESYSAGSPTNGFVAWVPP